MRTFTVPGGVCRKNLEKAAEWFRKAADKGDDRARLNLGNLYANGQGVPQDYTKAAEWYFKAANETVENLGCGPAQFKLGLAYERSLGVTQDFAKTAEWYGKAADQGNLSAQLNLGLLYGRGQGVPRDYIQAYKSFDLAARRSTASDAAIREQAVGNRSTADANMSLIQIFKAKWLVYKWKRQWRVDYN